MELTDALSALFLALVQGATEFLPISSSAHLIVPHRLFGWEDQGLAFDVATHFGTLGAVLLYFRKRLVDLGVASFQFVRTFEPSEHSRYAFYLLLATLPIVIVGWLSKDLVETHFRSIVLIGSTTLCFGLVLLVADHIGKRAKQDTGLTAWYAVLIGMAQVLALVPGTSRSGITITCALFLGFTRTAAAQFSFLLAIPTIGAASVLTMLDLIGAREPINWAPLAIACITSFIAAYLCIDFFLKLVEKIGMVPFVVYRVILGGGLLLWVWWM
ncbi:MAG: undecaprenyl-diphosphate phosphatase [Gammaproteobacteria bacterium]|nr:undecaprenyl-diphosphate phosphatase [Gammaproteobacteria bacterium]